MSQTLVQWADMGARVAYMSQTLVQLAETGARVAYRGLYMHITNTGTVG